MTAKLLAIVLTLLVCVQFALVQNSDQYRAFAECSSFVRVDFAGEDCRIIESWEDLNGSVCNSLQDVLNLLNGSEVWSAPAPFDCVAVSLSPGYHPITESTVLRNISIVLSGQYNGTETFNSTTLPSYCIIPNNNNNNNDGNNNNNNNNNNGNNNNNNQPSDQVDYSLCAEVPYEQDFTVHITFPEISVTSSLDNDSGGLSLYAWYFIGSTQVEITGINFIGSSGILGFENIKFLYIENCIFSHFSNGAVDVFKSSTLYVVNTVFAFNGPESVIKPSTLRPHSPGLSIAFTTDVLSTQQTVFISTCVFYNNIIGRDTSSDYSLSNVLRNYQYRGAGGAIALISNSVTPVSFTLQDSIFARNYAPAFGGGVYIFTNNVSEHRVIILRTQFNWNIASSIGGGLGVVAVRTSDSRISVRECEFSDNEAEHGGAAYFLPIDDEFLDDSNTVAFRDCMFVGNTAQESGSAIGVSSAQVFRNKEKTRPLRIRECSFRENQGQLGGVVSAAYYPLAFRGTNWFTRNRGLSLSLIGARVYVYGKIIFRDNNANGHGTGALYVTSLGQLQLYPGSNITFVENRGGIGAALVIDTIKVPEVFSRLLYNPLCTLLMEEPTISPIDWHQYNITFVFDRNQAKLIGSAVLLNNIQLCSWTNLTEPNFDPQGIFRWPFISYSMNQNEAHKPDQFNPEWYVQTEATRMNVTSNEISVYPGQTFSVGVEMFDEFEKPTTAFLRLSKQTLRNQASDGFMGLVLLKDLEGGTVTTSYRQFGNEEIVGETEVVVESILAGVGTDDVFTLRQRRCTPGRVLKDTSTSGYYTCDCNLDNQDIVDCKKSELILMDHLWGSVNEGSSGDQLVTYPCPGGYCRCTIERSLSSDTCCFIMDYRNTSNQCDCRRSGLLCGECSDGYGVSALLNKCVDCHWAHGFLILALVIADVLAVLGLLIVMVPFPPWLYPCIFYLQVLPFLTEHFPVTFEKARPYLFYVSSAFGLYLPYDICLGSSMDPLVSYAIRFIPFVTALILCPVILLIRRYKFVPVPSHGLWWLVLLLYTPVVHTSMSILNCPMITDTDGHTHPRWYINGELRCFTDTGHLFLGLFAIAVLITCALLIAAVALLSQDKFENPRWLHHTVEPLTNDFVVSWWGSVELARRLLLVLFIVAFPNNNYPAIMLLTVMLSWYGMIQPYEKLSVNILEVALSSCVLVMLCVRNTQQVNDDLQELPDQHVSGGSSSQCIDMDDIKGMTPMAILLSIFYYVPLAVTIGVVVVWTGSLAWNCFHVVRRKRRYSRREKDRSIRIPQKPHSFSVVDTDALSPPPLTPPGIRCEESFSASGGSCSNGIHYSYTHQTSTDAKSLPPGTSEVQDMHKQAAELLGIPAERDSIVVSQV